MNYPYSSYDEFILEYIKYSYNLNYSVENSQAYIWIIQYLQMLSTSSNTLAFFQNIINSPQQLANGYQLIKIFLLEERQNRRDTLLNLANPNVPILTLITNIYPSEIFTSPQLDQAQKEETRAFLANLLTTQLLKKNEACNPKLIELLFLFLHKMHNIEGFQDWVSLYQQALERLVENKSDRFGFFILNILKFADDRVNAFSRHILALVVGSDWIPNPQQQLPIIYYAYKSLAILVDSDPEVIQAYVTQCIQPTILYVVKNMQSSIKAMKYSLKILTVLLADYQLDCSQSLLQQIQSTTSLLVNQYLNYLNRGLNNSINSDIQFEEQQGDSDSIEIVIYQLLQLLLTLQGSETSINHNLSIYLCIVSTFLSQNQYRRYIAQSDQYVMEIEDEGEQNIRNKAIFFINQILQNSKHSKECQRMLSTFINQIITNLGNVTSKVSQFISNYHLPDTLVNVQEIYIESALVLLYSFTDELMSNQKQLTLILGSLIQNSAANSIDTILCLTVLNKIVKKQSKSYQQQYLTFLRNLVFKFAENIGMLLVIMRGLYTCSSGEELTITSDSTKVPVLLIHNLLNYLYRNDSAQIQSGYLIIQFLIHLLKSPENKPILEQLIDHPRQLYLLKVFINDGITSELVINLIVALKNIQTISAIYSQILHGVIADQSLPSLIAKAIDTKAINPSEEQMLQLCNIYHHKLDMVSDIIVSFLGHNTLKNDQLIQFLNTYLSPKWIHYLIKQNILFNLKETYLNYVRGINNATYPSQVENQLVLPYSIILTNANEAVQLLQEQGLCLPFLDKLFQYAKLFKGTHLRVTTLKVLASIAFMRKQCITKVIELHELYGKIEGSEWQDEEDEENIFDSMLTIVNEGVEKTFQYTFGELAWDTNELEAKMSVLRQMI